MSKKASIKIVRGTVAGHSRHKPMKPRKVVTRMAREMRRFPNRSSCVIVMEDGTFSGAVARVCPPYVVPGSDHQPKTVNIWLLEGRAQTDAYVAWFCYHNGLKG